MRRDSDAFRDFLILAAAVCIFVVLFWIESHGRQIALAVIVSTITFTISYAVYRVASAVREKRLDPTAQPMPLADVKAGAATHTAGLLGVGSALLHAPLGAPACAWYRVVVAPVAHPDTPIFELRSADALVLDDGQGAKLSVSLDGAAFRIDRSHDVTTTPDVPDAELDAYLTERGIAVSGAVRARVQWIMPHELVFVRGVAREVAPATAMTDALVYRGSDTASPLELVGTETEPVHIALEPLGAR